MCTGNIKRWYKYALYTFWTDHVTTWKVTGLTPYYVMHGVKPLLLFDITKAIFLMTLISMSLPTANLLAVWACMLQKCDEDLAEIYGHVLATHYTSIWDFKRKNVNRICNYDFKSVELVLVLNKWIEPEMGCKCKPHYLGPMVVVWKLRNGAYTLAEVNRIVSCLKFAVFHLIPYHPCSQKYLEIMEFVDKKDLEKINGEEGEATVEDMTRTSFLERKKKV